MNNPDEVTLATLMNIHELCFRTFSQLAGREVSSRVEGAEVSDPFINELITSKINQCIAPYTGVSAK